jgi:ribosomal protein L21
VYCVFDKEGKTVSVWAPAVAWAKVTAKVISHGKWDKMRVLKFQWKKRYQRVKWFRPHQTVVSIEKITA